MKIKRFVAILLTAMMLVSLTPTAAVFAEGPSGDGFYLITDPWNGEALVAKFSENAASPGEYILSTTLSAGTPLKAVHVTDGAIDGWYPGGTGNEYTVDAAHSGNVTVYFRESYFSEWASFGGHIYISVNHAVSVPAATEYGSVSSNYAQASENTIVTLTASPVTGCVLTAISASDAAGELTLTPGEGGAYSFTMRSSDVSVSASFEPKYTVTLKSGAGSGDDVVITSAGAARWAADFASAQHGQFYPDGASDGFRIPGCPGSFTAPADKTFKSWDKDGTEVAPGNFREAGSYALTALWQDYFAIAYSPLGSAEGEWETGNSTLNPSGAVPGTNVTLSVRFSPDAFDAGWRVEKYTVTDSGGAVTELTDIDTVDDSYGDQYCDATFTMPDGPVTVAAVVTVPSYAVTVDPVPEHGTLGGEPATARAGDTVTVSVSADAGYALKSGSLTAKDASNAAQTLIQDASDPNKYTFTMPSSAVKVSAQFVLDCEDGYYLVDITDSDAHVIIDRMIAENTGTSEDEYMLQTTLTAGRKLKVVRIEGGEITAWYPDGFGNEYTVPEDLAGSATVFFRPYVYNEWLPYGGSGYLYIGKNYPITLIGHNCTVEADYTEASRHTVVHLTLTGETNAEFVSISAVDADGTELTLMQDASDTNKYSFVMGEKAVTVEAFFTEPPVYYPLWVGGVQVSSLNKDNILGDTGTPTATYVGDASGGTLTLTNATLNGGYNDSKLYSELPALVIEGSFSFSGTTMYGIKAKDCSLTLSGADLTFSVTNMGIDLDNGSLTVESSRLGISSTGGYGIHCTGTDGRIEISSSTVDINTGSFSIHTVGSVSISDSSVKAVTTNINFCILTAKGFSISGDSRVEATSNMFAIYAESGISIGVGLGISEPARGRLSEDRTEVVDENNGPAAHAVIEGPFFSVTVSADPEEGGTASADMEHAMQGTVVAVTESSAEYWRFKEWRTSDGVVLNADGSFTMPASDVVITAVFERIPVTVTVDFGEEHEELAALYGALDGYTVSGSRVTMPLFATNGYDLENAVHEALVGVVLTEPYYENGFIHNGERLYSPEINQKPMSGYADESAWEADRLGEAEITDGTLVYLQWATPVTEPVTVSVEPPVCGVEVTTANFGSIATEHTVPQPVFTVTGAEGDNATASWYGGYNASEDTMGGFATGMIVGETTYYTRAWIKAPFGSFFDDPAAVITVSGGDDLAYASIHSGGASVVISVEAVHGDFDDAGVVTREPTETEPGEIEYCCGGCGVYLRTEEIPFGNYSVSVDEEIVLGSVTADKTETYKGGVVTVTAVPDIAGSVERLYYTGEGHDPVEITRQNSDGNYIFNMPDFDVVIHAEFNCDYLISVDFGEGHEDFVSRMFKGRTAEIYGGEQISFITSGSVVSFVYPPYSADYDSLTNALSAFEAACSGIDFGDGTDNGERYMNTAGLHTADYYLENYQSGPEYANGSPQEFFGWEHGGGAPEMDQSYIDGVTFYALWAQPVENAVLTVVPPECGTVVRYEYKTGIYVWAVPGPDLTAPDNCHFEDWNVFYNNWDLSEYGATGVDSDPVIMKGGNSYTATGYLAADWGRFLPDDFADTLQVEGGTLISMDARWGAFAISVPVEHEPSGEDKLVTEPSCTDPGLATNVCTLCGEGYEIEIPATGHTEGAAVREKETAPGCETAGSYDEVVYCTVCGAELSRKTVEIPATGHTEGEPVKEKETAPGCETPGSYDEVVYCTVCNNELSRKTVEIPATGHDWGEWALTTEPTETAEGVETRVCGKDASHTETRPVDKLGVYLAVSGDGQTWVKGSKVTADFRFKRSEKDELTFENFSGVLVDGKAVPSEYVDTEPGSVIIKLKPKYLETLSVGAHTLTAQFKDGKSATAAFKIVAKSTGGGTGGKPKTGDPNSLALCLAGMGLSASALFALVPPRRKKRR